MDISLPTRKAPGMPAVFSGEIFGAVGKYARGAVLYAFEEMGGPNALAEWGIDNRADFYTKLLPKIIARESEVQHTRSVDDIMDILDGGYTIVGEDVPTVPDVGWNEPDPVSCFAEDEEDEDMYYVEFPDA